MVKCCCLKDWFQNLLNPNYIPSRSPEVWFQCKKWNGATVMGFIITVIPIKSNLNCTLQHQLHPHDISMISFPAELPADAPSRAKAISCSANMVPALAAAG